MGISIISEAKNVKPRYFIMAILYFYFQENKNLTWLPQIWQTAFYKISSEFPDIFAEFHFVRGPAFMYSDEIWKIINLLSSSGFIYTTSPNCNFYFLSEKFLQTSFLDPLSNEEIEVCKKAAQRFADELNLIK